MRVFLDTNVLVSAFSTRGLCADVFRTVITEHDLVVGEVVLAELRRVLASRFKVPSDRIQEVEALLRSYEVVAKPKAMDPTPVRDRTDRWVLANARAAEADVLITGDQDLLAVADEAGIRILTPREFWEEIRRGAR